MNQLEELCQLVLDQLSMEGYIETLDTNDSLTSRFGDTPCSGASFRHHCCVYSAVA